MADRYTKTVLTIIALSLVWIAVRESIPSAGAQKKERFGQEVFIAAVSTLAAKCLRGHLTWLGTDEDRGNCVAAWVTGQ